MSYAKSESGIKFGVADVSLKATLKDTGKMFPQPNLQGYTG